jgi:hypothetical protein
VVKEIRMAMSHTICKALHEAGVISDPLERVGDFAPARRVNVPLLIGLAGGTGSGKTIQRAPRSRAASPAGSRSPGSTPRTAA